VSTKKATKLNTTVKAEVLRYLDDNLGLQTPKVIAQRLKLNYDSVRNACWKMAKEGILERNRPGLCVFYEIKMNFINKFYRMKQSDGFPFPRIHQLTLYFEGVHQRGGHGVYCRNCSTLIPEKTDFCLSCGLSLPAFGRNYHHYMNEYRHITITFGKHNDSLTVKLGCTLDSLSFEDFKHFLTEVQGITRVAIWKQLDRWVVKQHGLNKDIPFSDKKAMFDTNQQIILRGFGKWFAQQYKKELPEVGPVQRNELHGADPILADKFMAMVSGGITAAQAVSSIAATNKKIEDLSREIRGLARNTHRQSRQQSSDDLEKIALIAKQIFDKLGMKPTAAEITEVIFLIKKKIDEEDQVK